MKKLLIIVMACYGLNARSQVNESKNYLYLYSDSTIHAQKVRLRPNFLGSWVLSADSRSVPLGQVKFFNNERGFFANTRQLNFFGEASFAERIIEGKINLYQQIVYQDIPYDGVDYRFSGYRREPVSRRMFYNKGFADLKRVNYANLSTDMADNPQSLDLLKSYRKSMTTGTVMYVAAGAAILAGVVTLVSGDPFKQNGSTYRGMPTYKDRNYTPSFVLLGLGTGLSVGGFLIQRSGARNMERAIDNYNR
ncbi:hypothetical protein [Pedobacter sp. ASV12]|uniref:hypothetical protein n=1 Tax=Pedobacter sp. ASV12 TaxID=2795120 RepID=UPI0018EB101C|nr:hypothetical protein [Pedobacter sp. ASV12]